MTHCAGTIEAAVNGGVKNYIEAFFAADYVPASAAERAQVDRLKVPSAFTPAPAQHIYLLTPTRTQKMTSSHRPYE